MKVNFERPSIKAQSYILFYQYDAEGRELFAYQSAFFTVIGR